MRVVFPPSVPSYPGEPPAPHDLLEAWNAEPALLLSLFLTAVLYAWGVRQAWLRAGSRRGISPRRVWRFCGGMLALAAALVSPLDALSKALFSAHMVQHIILTFAAAPLLVTADLLPAFLWALPRAWSQAAGRWWNRSAALRRVWGAISGPVGAWLAFAIALWAWHIPRLYQAALQNEAVHALEHLIFLGTGMLFWWVLARPGARERRYGQALPYLFTTALHSGALGALMTFTTRPWYPYYTGLTNAWGFTALEDQQLAGLIMWAPVGLVITLVTLIYFAAWLHALEQRSGG